MSGGKLVSDPLFVGLTRPTLILGVSLNYAMLNMLVSAVLFIQKNSIKVLFLALIVHAIGYIACFREPRFMEIYMMKFAKCNKCSNKMYYGGNSYGI
jgi:type IV secretion system protein VirB3